MRSARSPSACASMPANSGSAARRSNRSRRAASSLRSKPGSPMFRDGPIMRRRLEIRRFPRHLGRMTDAANPLLATDGLPNFSAIEPRHIAPAVEAVLAEFRAAVDRLVADPEARSFATLIAPLERLED